MCRVVFTLNGNRPIPVGKGTWEWMSRTRNCYSIERRLFLLFYGCAVGAISKFQTGYGKRVQSQGS